ncbi:polyphosphate kinase 2 [Lysobacter sp. HA18]
MKDDTHAKTDHDDASNGNGKRKNGGGSEGTRPRMKRSEYEDALVPLQEELVKLQQWVVAKQKKVCIVLEGRDTAGKGGTIKAITDRVSPRVFRVVALPTPTDRERTQMYMQRYVAHLPSGGEVAIFDRSWYNRAGVERVMGFATDAQVRKFLETAPLLEKTMVASGVHLLKYWLEVSEEEQIERLKSRATDGRKLWKLSPMDLKSYGRWFDYSRARDAMFEATDTEHAPWYVANTDDKRRGRLNIIRHLLANVPYDEVEREKVQFPKRQKRGDYVESRHPLHFIEQRY